MLPQPLTQIQALAWIIPLLNKLSGAEIRLRSNRQLNKELLSTEQHCSK